MSSSQYPDVLRVTLSQETTTEISNKILGIETSMKSQQSALAEAGVERQGKRLGGHLEWRPPGPVTEDFSAATELRPFHRSHPLWLWLWLQRPQLHSSLQPVTRPQFAL